MANAPVTELVLSPRWTVTVGHIDGTRHVILRSTIHDSGRLISCYRTTTPLNSPPLSKKPGSDEMRGGWVPPHPQSGYDTGTIPAHRPRRGRWWSRLLRNDPAVTTKFIAT